VQHFTVNKKMSKLTPRSIVYLDAVKFGKTITAQSSEPIDTCDVNMQFQSAILQNPSAYTVSCTKLIVGLQRMYHNQKIDDAIQLFTTTAGDEKVAAEAANVILTEANRVNPAKNVIIAAANVIAIADNLAGANPPIVVEQLLPVGQPMIPMPAAAVNMTLSQCQSLQEMLQLIQNYAMRVVMYIEEAEYDGLQVERQRRGLWNTQANTFNEALPPEQQTPEFERPLLPLGVEGNWDVDIVQGQDGVYTYTGIDRPACVIAIDPGYHLFFRFNRMYQYGSGPIGDPEAANYYPGPILGNTTVQGWQFHFQKAFRGHFNIVRERLTYVEVPTDYYKVDCGVQDNYSMLKELNLSTSLMTSSTLSNAARKYRTFDSFSIALTGGTTQIGASFTTNNELTGNLTEVSLGELQFFSSDLLLARQQVIRQQTPLFSLRVNATITCFDYANNRTFETEVPLGPGCRFLAKFAFVAMDQQTTQERQLNYGL
jgi:hypothetical protein